MLEPAGNFLNFNGFSEPEKALGVLLV